MIAKLPEPEPKQDVKPKPIPKSREPPAGRRSPAATEIREYIARLRSTREKADEAVRELWEVDASLIPDLLLELENPAPTQLRELKIFIPDKDLFARQNVGVDTKGEHFVYAIPGLGLLAYDDIATGPARGRGLRVVIKRFERSSPFSVGEALRSAMLNRFRSTNYPQGDHRSDLVGWWQRYFENVKEGL